MLLLYTSLIDDAEEKLTFEYIYTSYRRQMFAVAMRILKNHADAEDAVQDALLGLAKSIHCVPRERGPQQKAYVLTVTRNAAVKTSSEQQKWHEFENLDDYEVSGNVDLFEQIANLEDYHRLLSMISRLPLQYREVLMMRYVLDLKPKEISAALGRKVTTVQQQIARGKKLLSAIYEKEVQDNGKNP